MTQTKTSKRALLTSALSLLLCCTMLIGTTWAWFTDSVTSAGNKIQSGTLKVDLLVKGGNTGVGLDEGYVSVKTGALANKPIFDYDLWEPGYTLVTYAKVVNNGSLALKYTLKFVSESDIAAEKLAEVIDVYYVADEVAIADRTELAGVQTIGTLKEVFEQGADVVMNDNLLPNKEDKATIVLKMKEEAGNEYQNQTIPAFDIQLLATQYTHENDSFDNKYDENAEYPAITAASVTNAASPLTLTVGDITVTVPAGSAAADDRFELVVENKNVTTDAEGKTTVSYDISLLKNGEKVTGTVAYTVKMNIGQGFAISSVKHNGAEIASYTYDPTVGNVEFTTTSFSPFSVTCTELPKVAKIGDKEYFSLDMATKDAKTGDTIELTEDIAVDSYVAKENVAAYSKKPAMVNLLNAGVTFDGKGHTITMSDDSEAYAFAKVYGTVKNVKFVNMQAPVAGDIMVGSKFENVTTEGEFNVSANTGAFGVYFWNTSSDSREVVFENCTNKVNLTGTGTVGDYNAAFLGYLVETNSTVKFINCVNEGDIVCGYAGMFIGNPRSYGGNPKVVIQNCQNNGLIHSTYAGEPEGRKHNILYGVTSDYWTTTTIDEVTYTMTQVKNKEADHAIGGTGTYKVGNPGETLAIVENTEDGTFNVTPSSNVNVAYYKVSVGTYVSLNDGGSGRYYATETIQPANIADATQVKNLKFVDKEWVETHTAAVESTATFDNNQKIYTLDGVEYYYVMNEARFNTHGNAKEATLISVSAFDSAGNLLASA